MAIRPIFIPILKFPFVKEITIDFEWYPGFSVSQSQKSIKSLHSSASIRGINPILEISTKSLSLLGKELSSFNIKIYNKAYLGMTVECAFQGSKVFEKGGPFTDLYKGTSIEAKKDDRLKKSGQIIGFDYLGETFPIYPQTAFYDWLYINALYQTPNLSNQILIYEGFSDIAFNPQKSLNCQARSAALFVALKKLGLIEKIIKEKTIFLKLITNNQDSMAMSKNENQMEFPFDRFNTNKNN